MARVLWGLLIVRALAGLGVASAAEPADANKPAPSRPVIVPQDLPAWRISLSVNPQMERRGRHYRPSVGIDSEGMVTIKENRPPIVNQRMEKADARELFAFLAETINGFYLTPTQGREYGPSHTNDLDETCWYHARVASGARAVEVTLEQAEPYRMSLDSRFFTVIAGANRQLRSLQDRFPEPLGLDASYRDPGINDVRDVVPERLSIRWGVVLRIRSKSQKAELAYQYSGTERLGIAVDEPYEWHDSLKRDVGRGFYDCARIVVNRFELRGGLAPQEDEDRGARIELEVTQPFRSIRVEFDETDMPLEWHRKIAATIGIANEQVGAGKKKINALGRTEDR
jgi:hypothetical protein